MTFAKAIKVSILIIFFSQNLFAKESCQDAQQRFISDIEKAQMQKQAAAARAANVKGASAGGNNTQSSGGNAQPASAGGSALSGISAMLQAQAQGAQQIMQVDMQIAKNEQERIKQLLDIQRDFWKKEDELRNKIREQEKEQRLMTVKFRTAETGLKNSMLNIEQECKKQAREIYTKETETVQTQIATRSYVAKDFTKASGTEKRRKARQRLLFKECMKDQELMIKKAYNDYELAMDTIKANSDEFMKAIELYRSDVEREKERFKIYNQKAEEGYQISKNALEKARSEAKKQASLQQMAALIGGLAGAASASGGSGDVGKDAAQAAQRGYSCLNGEKVSPVPVSDIIMRELKSNLEPSCEKELIEKCFQSESESSSSGSARSTSSGSGM